MKIALVGYGKMGKMIEQMAIEQEHRITAVVDPAIVDSPNVFLHSDAPLCGDITECGDLWGADVAIEFSQPGMALANIKALAQKKIPAVIGTTGWHDQLDQARQVVEKAGSALIWASNFSLGVNIFNRIAWFAAQLIDSFPEYDIGGFEAHHNKKLDSPSGTAITLVDGVLARMSRKEKAVWETLDRLPQPEEIHFPSLRLGSVPGKHSVFIDSAADTIEISHTARSREGFANGALRAAQWLIGGESSGARKGFFTIDDMLQDIFSAKQG